MPLFSVLATQSSSSVALPATIGAGVAGTIGLFDRYLAFRRERRRDRTSDMRRLRDNKRERLRTVYYAVLTAGLAVNQHAVESTFRVQGERDEERPARLNATLSQALTDLHHARLALMLEADDEARSILDCFEELWTTFIHFNNALDRAGHRPGSDEPGKHGERLHELMEKLRAMTRDHLRALEEPL